MQIDLGRLSLHYIIRAPLRVQFDLRSCVIRALAHSARCFDKAALALYYSSAAQSAI